ncbi:MAG TPA: phage Gp37/Gp68 family protein [Candidatus Acidoferrales bacterium]|nr:phage Gp37/Gp68 family protein [Candidatus Acidoferrales bacterium]
MGDRSKIEWTDATWNPVRGCSLVSAGCTNCYAMREAHRHQSYGGLTRSTEHGPVWTGEVRVVPELLDQPLRWKRPRRIFVNSMSDLFHESIPLEFVGRVYGVMRQAHWHTFQVLTKRPERMREFFDWWRFQEWKETGGFERVAQNIWWGISAENQPTFDDRLPFIQDETIPAAVRFLSLEPLLAPIDISDAFQEIDLGDEDYSKWSLALNWVILGGESGPCARPMDLGWVRSIVRQCKEAEVPCFVKQLGAVPVVDENEWRNNPVRLLSVKNRNRAPAGTVPLFFNDSKAGDWNEWPKDLQVREFPA